ncbi:MAG: glycosyltransferase family 39 protein [Anaerolineae bacterium]|nr:glycosyltransferase family 39 protein [Anaerolineae bacterium]
MREGVYRPWDQEGTQPPLYHILAAVGVSWLDLSAFQEPPRNPHYVDERSFVWFEQGNNNLYLHNAGEAWSLSPIFVAARLARWLSLLAGLGTIGLTYFLARIIFENGANTLSPGQIGESENQQLTRRDWRPLLAAASIAFIPQFLHVSSAITNDSLSVTLAAAALTLMALILTNGGSTRYAGYLGLVLGLGAISKLSLLYLLPLAGLVLLGDLFRHRSWRRFWGQGLIIGGLVLLLAGWWYWRNWQLYEDVTALKPHLLYRGGALDPRPPLAQIWQTEMAGLEISFWAAFGAGQILLEPWLYRILGWIKYLVLGGVVIGFCLAVKGQMANVKYQMPGVSRLVGHAKPGPSGGGVSANRYGLVSGKQLMILALLMLWCLIIFLALLRWMQITPASWGRLLYPALPAVGVLAIWGLTQYGLLVLLWGTQNRSHWMAIGNTLFFLLPFGLIVGLFALSVVSPFRYIRATYAKTPLISEVEVPPEIDRLDLIYDNAIRLIGYNVEKTSVHPGEWLPVTLYWQAIHPLDKNYSVFVHVLGRDNKVVGQVNTYPDHGNWPTSLLIPNQVLRDTYYVPVSAEAEAPAVLRLALGIFEFEDSRRAAKLAVNSGGEVVEPIVGAIPLLPRQWPQLTPSRLKEVNFAGQIKLVGYDWSANAALKPDDVASLTLYWETLSWPGQNLNLFIHLVDAFGAQVAGFDGPPPFPTVFWQPGYTIIDSRPLALPADLPAGDYKLIIGWYNLDNFSRLPLENGGDAFTLLTVSVENGK